jgi:putative ABC transport system permease protein
MRIYIRLIYESIAFAFNALIVNKLRTFLSLLGVTIGIFAIIAVFTVVDSLENNIRDSVQSLGDNVVYIQKWPWGGGGGDYAWWKYFQRPDASYDEMVMVRERSHLAESVVFAGSRSTTAKYLNNSIENVGIFGVSHDYIHVWNIKIIEGRYFTEQESMSGRNLAILGADIAEGLFGGQSAVGREIKAMGRKLLIIGVLEKEGQSIVGNSNDELIIVPVLFMDKILDINGSQFNPMIMTKAKEGVDVEQMTEELRGIMRSLRRLPPRAEDNFALNEISVLSQGLTQMFGIIDIAGWIIGGFSILVGGFGIANIMFVSVKERTNLIGIQKSLGAKNFFVLFQFLFESITLCVIGGAVGLVLVGVLSYFATNATGFNLFLSVKNIIMGLSISVVIGLISGLAPALSASRLDPVEAIRSGI